MTTITIERATLDRLIDAWDSTVLPKSRDGMMQERMEDLRAALAAPAAAPEKTVKEIMEFVRHYAANTFSSATLEDKIRRSLAAPATAPEQPSWQDAPTVPGNWWGKSKANGKHEMFVEITQREIGSRPPWFPEYRWFGPIPEDKP